MMGNSALILCAEEYNAQRKCKKMFRATKKCHFHIMNKVQIYLKEAQVNSPGYLNRHFINACRGGAVARPQIRDFLLFPLANHGI